MASSLVGGTTMQFGMGGLKLPTGLTSTVWRILAFRAPQTLFWENWGEWGALRWDECPWVVEWDYCMERGAAISA